ncbi:MAG: hypothetical protein GX542_04090 [Rhodococcus sp.]|nr:hypothetical protein [Rhodococcus sp. (in: high G+C Gram-positive bacteria)]
MTAFVDLRQRMVLPDRSADDLRALLKEKSWTLPEWFSSAAPFHAPDHLVPDVLDLAIAYPSYREELLNLAGDYGQQLAHSSPQWSSLRRFQHAGSWTSLAGTDRLQWLRDRRRTRPAEAVAQVARTWSVETSRDRADFLGAFTDGLGNHDIALLERALDDDSSDVRLAAVQLLRRLPASPFAARMAARSRAWIRLEPKPIRPRLVVNLPGSLDRSARRDGIENVHFKNKGIQRWWLRMAVTATPLWVWEEMIGSAEAAWEIPIEESWRAVIREAWTSAIVLQRNPRWAGAMLQSLGRQTPHRVVPLAPIRQRVFEIRSGLTDSYLLDVDGQSLFEGLPHPWPDPVVTKVVELLVETADRHADSGRLFGPLSRHSHYTTLRRVEAHFPFPAAILLDRAAARSRDPEWARAFSDAAEGIRRRRRMLDELR